MPIKQIANEAEENEVLLNDQNKEVTNGEYKNGQQDDNNEMMTAADPEPVKCISPQYYIKANAKCEQCVATQTSGYMSDT